MSTIETRIAGILGLPSEVVAESLEEDSSAVPCEVREAVDKVLPASPGFEELVVALRDFPENSPESREIARRTRDLLASPGFSLAEAMRAEEQAGKERSSKMTNMMTVNEQYVVNP